MLPFHVWYVLHHQVEFALTLPQKGSPISSPPRPALCSAKSLDETRKVSLHLECKVEYSTQEKWLPRGKQKS